MKNKDIYNQVISKLGTISQMDMCIEECAELIQAINKVKRNNCEANKLNLLEEIADVEIMIEQMRIMVNQDKIIDKIKKEKINRLHKSLMF